MSLKPVPADLVEYLDHLGAQDALEFTSAAEIESWTSSLC
jgi:hypothetical protein